MGTFKVGEKVVYPAHGVGVIEGVQTKVISGSERKFYMLRIIDSDMTIMIPTENVQSVGLRRVIGKVFRVQIKGWCSEFETRDAAGRQAGAHAAG